MVYDESSEDRKQNLANEIHRAIRRLQRHDLDRKELEERLAYWQRVWRNNNYGQYPF